MLISTIVDKLKVRTNEISRMTKKKFLSAVALMATATAAIYMLGNKEELIPHLDGTGTPAVSDVALVDAETNTQEERANLDVAVAAAPSIELVSSIFLGDQDIRNEAIAEAEKVVEATFGIGRGVLRYEPVLIDSSEIIIGDLSQPGAIAKEFKLSFLSNVSFKATETEFKPLDVNNQALWRGVLDEGDGGTIEMTIHAGGFGSPSLSIRLNAPPYYFLLFPLDNMPNVYVAAEANVAYRRAMKTD